MSKKKINNELNEIVSHCISSKSLEFTTKQFIVPVAFIENKSIISDDSEKYSINHKSEIINGILLDLAEQTLNKKLPKNFSDAIKFVKEFENEIKKPETNVSWAGLIELTHGLSAHTLAKLHNEEGQNLPEFVFQIIYQLEKREHHLFAIERYFSLALPFLNISSEDLLEILKQYVNSDKSQHSLIIFSKDLAQCKPLLTIELFELIEKDDSIEELKVIPASLIIGLYNQGDSSAFSRALNLFSNHPDQTIHFLGRINFKNQADLKTALAYCDKIDSSNFNLVKNSIEIYSNILKSTFIEKETKELCFIKLQEAFEIDNVEFKNTILDYFSYWIVGCESERYSFLLTNLGKTENKDFIKHYFDNFKDPSYFFDFFQKMYQALDQKLNMDYFEHGLSHFWQTNQEKTESFLLAFLSSESVEWRKAGVKLLNSKYSGIYNVSILKLSTEIEQLRCLEALSSFNLTFESFLPVILPFRNSTFPKVKKELQGILSFLVFESYHDSLYNLLTTSLGTSKADKSFLKPIKKALDNYHELVKIKDSVKDLDPVQNERSYMDLYYRLEHENKAKMMDSIKNEKSGLMSLFGRNKIIVRGHSWKLEGRDEVSPLGRIEHSVMVDSRVYKNSELFENNMKNPKSKY